MVGKPSRPRFFLDANILFSAAYDAQSRSALLFDLAKAGRCTLATSSYAREEARRNLASKRPEALTVFEHRLQAVPHIQEPDPRVIQHLAARHMVPVEDAPILAAAIQAGVDALVTGDRTHFGHLMGRSVPGGSLYVLSLAEALRRVLAGKSD
ncbi:MAG: PIN domain-containing protein [Candidatus Omnitrophica bacterium]|nr:PIN domain-containing protein [Candidatus Omnitrophota bacterium]